MMLGDKVLPQTEWCGWLPFLLTEVFVIVNTFFCLWSNKRGFKVLNSQPKENWESFIPLSSTSQWSVGVRSGLLIVFRGEPIVFVKAPEEINAVVFGRVRRRKQQRELAVGPVGQLRFDNAGFVNRGIFEHEQRGHMHSRLGSWGRCQAGRCRGPPIK